VLYLYIILAIPALSEYSCVAVIYWGSIGSYPLNVISYSYNALISAIQ